MLPSPPDSPPPSPPPGLVARPAKKLAAAPPATGGLSAALEARAGSLKSVETRVRQRDGTLLVEHRGQDGFKSQVTGRDEAKPQYLQDQELGLSRLTPKVFDVVAQRWQSVEAVRLEDAARLNEAELSQRGLQLVTYNVWFSEYRQWARAQAMFAILSSTNADVICLQEVTPKFLSWLRDESFVRLQYTLSDAVGTTLRGSELSYGVVLLIRRELHISWLRLYELPSQMSRALLVASFPLPGQELRVATVHLESLDATPMRLQQLERICEILTEGEAAAVLAGDMNFTDGAPEEQVVRQAEFVDSAMDSGCTMPFDDFLGRPTRIDRVFVHSAAGGSWRLLSGVARRLGETPAVNLPQTVPELHQPDDQHDRADSDTDPEMPALVCVPPGEVPERCCSLPSDHYGLACHLELLQRKAAGARSLPPLS